jgi:subtilase family serine protease
VIGPSNLPHSCDAPAPLRGSSPNLVGRGTRIFLQSSIAVATLLFASLPAGAQGTLVRPRITQRVDENRLAVLQGHIHPLARPQFDQGPVDPALKLERISLMFQPTAEQQAALDSLLLQQQDPSSPNFHKWLTPEEYGGRFGVSQSDLDKVVAWLQGQGFAVVETARSRNWVAFTGTAAQVQSALYTEIHNYSLNGQTYFANAGEPAVPSAFASMVLGFRGLNNFPLKPRGLKSREANIPAHPNFTSEISGSHFLAPDDFATIYDLKPLYSSGIDGTGQKIAVVGQTNIVPADIATFRSRSGLPANSPQLILVQGSTDPGVVPNEVPEASLDIEWSGAVAPKATIIYVYSKNGAFDSLAYAIEQNFAPVISISYGACESNFTANDALVGLAQQANTQGITIVAASGDSGAADCDSPKINPALKGLAVDFPASLPYVTGVGGTEFAEGNGMYWDTANNSNNGSARSYIPETTWNDTPSSPGLAAGGGGVSKLFAKPVWQAGTGIPNDPNDKFRHVPDISVNASPAHDGYLVCTQVQASTANPLPNPPPPLTSGCQNGFRISSTNPNLSVYGGTSFGAPTFAGIVALINQKTGSAGQGNVNPILYPLAGSAPSAFHDVTTGNNSVPCSQGTPDCPNGGTIGFNATPGYDMATGLGSFDATNMVNSWSSGTTSPSLSASPTMQTVTAGSSATFQINNASSTAFALTCSGVPTGASCGAVSVGGNSTAALVISTTSRSAALPPLPQNGRPYSGQRPGMVIALLALSALSWLATRRRCTSTLIPASALILLLALCASGCGGSGSGTGKLFNPNGTPAGTYTITVNGTSGSTNRSTTVTLQVN